MDVIRSALTEKVESRRDPNWQFTSETPYRIDVALHCVELGDTTGLSIWLEKIDRNLDRDPLGDYESLIVALKNLLKQWQQMEAVHGVGALLHNQYWLRFSPAYIVGLDRITNAKRFQEINSPADDDPFWALQFG